MSPGRDHTSDNKQVAVHTSLAESDALIFAVLVVQDFSWMLLLSPLAWPASLTAIALKMHQLWTGWTIFAWTLRGQHAAMLVWLIGRAIWMASELTGLHQSEQDDKYGIGCMLSQSMFCVGMLLMAISYLYAWSSFFLNIGDQSGKSEDVVDS